MKRCVKTLLAILFLPNLGCLSEDSHLSLVPQNPFGRTPAQTPAGASLAPASLETAARVDRIGVQVCRANEKILGFKPTWSTIGVPQLEIFHRDISHVFITEGLAKQCVTDGQLAAVLCLELGKIRSEMEIKAGLQVPLRAPPMEVSAGGEFG